MAGSQANLAGVCAGLRDCALARSHLSEAVAGFQAVGDPLGVCECLEAGAELALAEGRFSDAVRFVSSAAFHRERLPSPRSPLLARTMEDLLAELRGALGDEAYETAWREGHEIGDAALERFVGDGRSR